MGQAAGLSNGVKNPAHSVSSRNGRTGFSGALLIKKGRPHDLPFYGHSIIFWKIVVFAWLLFSRISSAL